MGAEVHPAEADQQYVLAQRMDVTTFESVIQAALGRSVVKNPLVRQLGMRGKERFHDELLGPTRVESHRADHHVLIYRHRGIAGEKKIGEWRERVAELVESAG